MIKYIFLWKQYILFLYINKKLKILTKQNIKITIKFLSSLIKNVKYFNQEKS